MRQVITDRCKVWEINDKNGTAEVKISSSRKVNENNSYDKVQIENGVAKNGYIADYRSFVRFVGHAYHQLKDIKIGDTITNLESDSSKEPYWSSNEGCIKYPNSEKITVFSFEKYDPEKHNQGSTRNLDKAPQVAEEPKEEVPSHTHNQPTNYNVEQPTKSVESSNNISADDECPF